MRKGFTLLELIVVVIILGILATLAITQYTKLVEKGRSAEAKTILGQIRTAQAAYYQQYGSYTSLLGDLAIADIATACGQTTHYFSYSLLPSLAGATAARCTTGGKTPAAQAAAGYSINITYSTGEWSGTAGYF